MQLLESYSCSLQRSSGSKNSMILVIDLFFRLDKQEEIYNFLGACNAPLQLFGRMQCATTTFWAHAMRHYNFMGACNAPLQLFRRMQCATTTFWAHAMRQLRRTIIDAGVLDRDRRRLEACHRGRRRVCAVFHHVDLYPSPDRRRSELRDPDWMD